MEKRPALITVLGVLNIIAGIIGLIQVFTDEYASYTFVLGNTVLFFLGAFAIFSIVIGIGFFKGWKWTWFAALFLYILKVGQYGLLLVQIFRNPFIPVSYVMGPVVKMLVILVITVLIIVYMMKDDAMYHFEVDEFKKKQYFAITSICSVLVIVAVYGFVVSQLSALGSVF